MVSNMKNTGSIAPVQLTPSMVPHDLDIDFEDSTFFKSNSQPLPSPEEVVTAARNQAPESKKTLDPIIFNWNPPPTEFESMNLIVKWGTNVSISEGRCLYTLGRYMKSAVPVPEVYGWRTTPDFGVFIYMERLSGQTLEKAWDSLADEDRVAICRNIGKIMTNLRSITQDASDPFIGSISRTNVHDRALGREFIPEAGPFTSVKQFHDWFSFLCRRPMEDPHSIPIEPFRHQLFDNAEIKFTHSDLHPSNIIIPRYAPYSVVGIVDWEQSGWLPEYWEDRKARYSVDANGEWATTYLPMILQRYDDTEEPWYWYICPV